MKKIFFALLVLCTIATSGFAIKAAASELNALSHQVVPCTNIYGFEESYDGYETSIDLFDGKMVRVINRNGADETKNGFNMYNWNRIKDENGQFIPLETANYIVIDYYYHSPDEQPALVGNCMGWVQGRIVPSSNVSKIVGFSWSEKMMSTGMVANKWDKLVISLKDNPTVSSL